MGSTNGLQPVSADEFEQILCFNEWLNGYRSDEHCYLVLRQMTKSFIECHERGSWPGEFFADWIASQLGEEKGEDSWSSWMAWSTILKYWDKRKDALFRLSRERGLTTCVVPIQTYSGKKNDPSRYFLGVMDIPSEDKQASLETASDHEQIAPDVAIYTKHMDVKPTWFAKPFFKNGEIQFKSWRGRLIRIGLVSSLIIMLLLVIAGFFSYSRINQPLTPSFLLGMLMTLGIPAYFWHEFWMPWIKLIENRIIVASDTYIALSEKTAQFELMREGKTRWIQLVRYTAPCPMCGATLHLAEGKPDFPSRIVGRCSESPREHIYSFDRVTRMGYALRETGHIPSKNN